MVTPYLTQHSPPALVAMLPPIEHISNDDGSGGYHRPCSRAAALTAAFSAPGSTTATRLAGSMLIERIRSRLSTMPPVTAEDPPDSPLPAPRGTTGDPVSGRPPHDGLHLAGVVRAQHRQRHAGIRIAGPVVAVVLDQHRIGDQRVGRKFGGELVQRGGHS